MIRGIGRTGRLVTSAALILFLAFIVDGVGPGHRPEDDGHGLAAGILLDATVIRALIVPAVIVADGPLELVAAGAAGAAAARGAVDPAGLRDAERHPLERPDAAATSGVARVAPVATPTRRFHIPSALRRSSSRLDVETAQRAARRAARCWSTCAARTTRPPRCPESVRIAPDEVPGPAAGVPARHADRARLHLTARGDQRPCGALAEGPGVTRRTRVDGGHAALLGAPRSSARRHAHETRDARPLGRSARCATAASASTRAGVLFSLTGNWVEAAAFGYVVLLLGGSAATLGLIGFLNTIPNLIWGLPAGRARGPLRPAQAAAAVPGREHAASPWRSRCCGRRTR